VFWSAIGMLAMLEIFGVLLNLVPIPGIDGYGIISPFLPEGVRMALAPLHQFTFIFLLLLFFTPLGGVLREGVFNVCLAFNLDPRIAITGLGMFQFWR
jgi:Zn-dependent protease